MFVFDNDYYTGSCVFSDDRSPVAQRMICVQFTLNRGLSLW